MINRIWTKLKQLFCKHVFMQAAERTKFHALNGQKIYTVCEKCEYIKSSYWAKYD